MPSTLLPSKILGDAQRGGSPSSEGGEEAGPGDGVDNLLLIGGDNLLLIGGDVLLLV